MSKRSYLYFRVLLAAAIMGAAVLAGCSPMQSGRPGPAAGVEPGGVPQEGVKVHGRWTIEVMDPNGTVVERTEFNNALTDSGKYTLAWFLGRANGVGQWFVRVETYNIAPPVTMTSYYLREAASSQSGTYQFKTLTVDGSGPQLTLRGTATAQTNLTVNAVQTFVWAPAPTVSPSSSSEGGMDREFTWTVLPAPVAVSAGQQVAVTVVISFS
ncbi:MAG: hypothetical protein HY673_20275 [Chloroflexi bacterium]|nr:hypothetical protein [Chloroflexota bacterium]